MKKLHLKLLSLITFALLLSPGSHSAQVCNDFFSIKDGVRMEYTMYGKKGKVEGSQWQEFRNVEETADGIEAEVHMGFNDAQGKNPYESSYKMTCEGNTVRIDYESLISPQMLEQYGDAEVEITGTDVEWPSNLETGMELPDANVKMKINMGGMNMNMEVDITDRKVEKVETITVPAGSFECYVVYSNSYSKMMMVNKNFPSRSWLAKGVGMVKTESYNKKGKLINTMVLSAISQ